MAQSARPGADRLRRAWERRRGLALALLPVSWLYGALVKMRQLLYCSGVLPRYRAPVPVVVVGNVVAGGAGKTPVTIAILEHLQSVGWSPGVVSRGYGRAGSGLKCSHHHTLDPAIFGDEPALIAQRCQVPVAVAEKRSDAAAALLVQHPQVNILVSDDGLQHLAMQRDIEICVFNSAGVGNGWLLPAGPLREPWPRPVELVVFDGTAPPPSTAPAFRMHRRLAEHAVTAQGEAIALACLADHDASVVPTALWAVAGTARPEEFFAMLRNAGVPLAGTTALPDHYNFDSWERTVDKRYRLIFTEKDAVKLWPRFPDALAVRLELDVEPGFFAALDTLLAQKQKL